MAVVPEELWDAFAQAKDVCDAVTRLSNMKPITVKYKSGISSYSAKAFMKKGYIVLTDSALRRNKAYITAVVIHEVCHFINYQNRLTYDGHGFNFREAERKWLREFGLIPVYKKAYWHTLTNLSGKVVWSNLAFYKEVEVAFK